MRSPKSVADDGLSSCSSFPEKPTPEKLDGDKTVIPQIERIKGKATDEQLAAIEDLQDRNQDVFSRHKADIECCNFVEH